LSVLDNLDRHDIPDFGEKILDFRIRDLVREVGYVNFPVHASSFKVPDLLKHSTQSTFLSSGGRTGGDDFLFTAQAYDFVGLWMPKMI
jgi:hypothetical protein